MEQLSVPHLDGRAVRSDLPLVTLALSGAVIGLWWLRNRARQPSLDERTRERLRGGRIRQAAAAPDADKMLA